MNNPQQSNLIHQCLWRHICASWLLLLLALPAVVQAQFTYTTSNGTITITRYAGPGGAVTIPSTINGLPVTSIGDFAFDGCNSLTSVTIGNGVSSIGNAAFYLCTSLTTITIPNSVTNLGNDAFAGCTSLTGITVDASNPVYSSLDGVLFNKSQTTLIQCPGGKAGSYSIPISVTNVGDSAFDCPSLTSVTIPDGVTSIGNSAFDSCGSLTSLTIPDSVTSIGYYAFASCSSLTNITIGNGLTSIATAAFEHCTKLASVTIGDSVSSIANEAFWDCPSLTSVTFGNGLISIGDSALGGCHSLASVTIPDSVTSIGIGAFNGCWSLTNVTAGTSVTSIGPSAFYNCTRLTSVYFRGNAPSLGGAVFDYWDMGYQVSDPVTSYYLPGTTGWASMFGGRPAALWLLPYPTILSNGSGFGVQTNGFGFIISWATNIPVVVEASTNLADHTWSPVATNTLTGGSSYFSDPQWANYPARFYRLRQP
jgi:hypothetical protein